MNFNIKLKNKAGSGKKLRIRANQLPFIKQAPFLVRSLKKFLPDLKIELSLKNEKIFRNDLKLNEISLDNLLINDFQKEKFSFLIDFSYDNEQFNHGHFSGNIPIDDLKFEERYLLSVDEINELKEKYKIRGEEEIILFGSAHNKDINYLGQILKEVLTEDNKKKLIIVPRYFSENLIVDNPVDFFLNKNNFLFESDFEKISGNTNCLVINEQGILDKLYSLADIVLMGDTFDSSFGDGQNPLEPAFYGKRIISGSNYRGWNKLAFKGLKKSGLLKVISSPQGVLKELLRKSSKQDVLASEKAKKFIVSQQGAGDIYAKIIKKKLYGKLTSKEGVFLSRYRNVQDLKDYFLK